MYRAGSVPLHTRPQCTRCTFSIAVEGGMAKWLQALAGDLVCSRLAARMEKYEKIGLSCPLDH